jgi:hypothetical protein
MSVSSEVLMTYSAVLSWYSHVVVHMLRSWLLMRYYTARVTHVATV